MAEPIAQKLLLVGWDAADWQVMHLLIDSGRMPNLKCLVEAGVIGNLLTLQPVLSPILWTSIATGKRGYLHGVHGFVEPTPDGTALRPTASSTPHCKALWNILAKGSAATSPALGRGLRQQSQRTEFKQVAHREPRRLGRICRMTTRQWKSRMLRS